MAKNTTSFALDGFGDFVRAQVESGDYATASEVIREALRRMQRQEARRARELALIDEAVASGISPASHEQIWAGIRARRAARGA